MCVLCLPCHCPLRQPGPPTPVGRCQGNDRHSLKLPAHRLLKWIEDGIPKDPFLNPDLMKNNPWVEKAKCTIL